MNAIGWNCRGVGSARTVRVLKEMIKSHKPDILFLSKTLADSSRIVSLASQLGFVNFFSVDKQGRGGGLAMFWKHNLVCRVVDSSNNHIDLIVRERNGGEWRLTGFYGFPERERRQESWDFLRTLASNSTLPWCVLGDFNDLLASSDKKGRHKHPQNLLDGFRSAIEDSSLIEVELKGGEYTWEKSKGTSSWVRERLDRCFASGSWWNRFPLCTLTVFHATVSDHEPIKLELLNVDIPKKQFRFRFENTWLKENSFHTEVTNFWKNLPALHLLPKLLAVSNHMAKWGRMFFNKFREKVIKQKEVIDSLKNREDDDGIQMYFEEKDKLHELLMHEEAYWKQRAKAFWLKDGDTNSKYFHATASSRKKVNYISGFKAENGTLITNHEEMCRMLQSYFSEVFTEGGSSDIDSSSEPGVRITSHQNDKLIAELSFAEFTQALKNMHPDKASGPDGLNPAFFQHFWDLIGKEVFNCCKQWLVEGSFSAEVNDTNLVLIPKKDSVDDPKDLRPIALCNVLYKIFAKVLANRLQKILPEVISEEQSAFVPGRNITDNVLVAFELLHYMKRKNNGSEGEVALKLDISKAYDRVSWGYLKSRMTNMGFSEKWINWVMMCVSTVSYSIVFQGSTIGPIFPTRGLRQGDPLSPYLFLLCVDGLSEAIKSAAINNQIHGCRICTVAPSVTHLLFADDSFLFFKATTNEASAVKHLLNEYERWSGQAVNYQKSAIFFSSNVRTDKQLEIREVLEVHKDIGDSKYLGLPSLIGRSKKTVFRYLKDKVIQKIKGWSAKLLSRAGKMVMLKNVVQSVPAYAMSCFLLPKSLGQEIQRVMNAFWWQSSSSNSKGIKWLAWEKMCTSKHNGGLGFRDIYGFNLALLGKQCWSLMNRPQALVSRVLKARYFPDCHFLQAIRTGGASYTWSGIWEAKEEMKKGLRWVVGDGKDINIGVDRWLRAKNDFKVDSTTTSSQAMSAKVCDFFQDNNKVWDVGKIMLHFSSEDAAAILNIRIPQMCTRDRIAWIHSSNGQYTVKSGYYNWCKQQATDVRIQQSRGWRRLWTLAIPYKIRVFMWRFCRNTVPVRNILRGRGVPITIGCPQCTGEIEHLRHLFFECNYAKECWQQTGIEVNLHEVEIANEWVIHALATKSEQDLIKISIVLWGLWFARNKKIFENKNMPPAVIMAWSTKQVKEWQIANRKIPNMQTNEGTRHLVDHRWVPPMVNQMKINVDASVVEGQNSFAIGMVIRNHSGQYVAGKTMRFGGSVSVLEAEITGIVEALLWSQQTTTEMVNVESDSLLGVTAVNRDQSNLLELGDLIKQGGEILKNNPRLSVSHVKKQANKLAHTLARFPCELNSFIVTSSPPSLLLETILSDDLVY